MPPLPDRPDRARAPHGNLYNNHPHNLVAWAQMRYHAEDLYRDNLTITGPALALWYEREYFPWLQRTCITHDILLQIAEDAARFPYYPLPYKK